MNKKWFVVTVFFLAIVAATFFGFRAYALKSECPMCQMGDAKMSCCSADGFLCQKLCMSPEQSKTLSALDKEFDASKQALYSQMDQDKAAIAKLLTQTEPDQKQLDKAMGLLNQHRAALEQAALNHLLKIKKILDPKQKKEFAEMVSRQLLE